MSIKNIIILFIAVISFCGEITLKAQDVNYLNTSDFFVSPLMGRRYINSPGLGSPFLFGNFLNGYVVLTSRDTVYIRKLKFDCYKNELIWLANGADLISLDVNFINAFSITSTSGAHHNFELISSKFPIPADSSVKYIQMLSIGKVSLYCYRKISISNEAVSGNSGGMYQVNKYVPHPDYYLQIGSLPIKQIQLTKNSLIKTFPEYAVEIKRILRENNVGKLKKEWQLVDAVKLLNDKMKIN